MDYYAKVSLTRDRQNKKMTKKMIKKIMKIIIKKIIDPVSIRAIHEVGNSNAELKRIWEDSLTLFPDFKHHYSFVVESKEVENRIRLLVAAEAFFIKKEIDKVITAKDKCTYADVGDSDGSVRLLLKKYFGGEKLASVGINLQASTVEKIRKRGLDAICTDALSLEDRGIHYDIVSLFETLEHLPDPLGFLNGIRKVVDKKLVLSVPFIRHSRVGLNYLSDRWVNKWPQDMKTTIENTHIFELSPLDWKKIFLHTGWKVDNEWNLMMFPSNKISRLILQPFWRVVSFEGFWFVSLFKDNKYSSRYTIE